MEFHGRAITPRTQVGHILSVWGDPSHQGVASGVPPGEPPGVASGVPPGVPTGVSPGVPPAMGSNGGRWDLMVATGIEWRPLGIEWWPLGSHDGRRRVTAKMAKNRGSTGHDAGF